MEETMGEKKFAVNEYVTSNEIKKDESYPK